MPKQIEKYVTANLSKELEEVIDNIPTEESINLDNYEKTLIYKYTGDGYDVNGKIKNGNINAYAKLLNQALDKADVYRGIVYRGTNFEASIINHLISITNSESQFIYLPFLSTSKKYIVALKFEGNCIMQIVSKQGRDIEGISRFGKQSPFNEYEVLFKMNTKFRILEVRKDGEKYLIKMEEIL